MELQLLSTASPEGWPALFCGCSTCARARATRGKNIRTRASLQVDRVYKIDFPPDSYMHSIRHGIEFSELKCLFFTHSHRDHFAIEELFYLREPFAYEIGHAPVKIYANCAVLSAIQSAYTAKPLPVELIEAKAFEPIRDGDLSFIPITAQHDPSEDVFNYIIQSSTATALYACDTGPYDDATIARVVEHKFDLLIIECTQGPLNKPSRQHMGFDAVVDLRDRLDHHGALKPSTRTVITHLSHNIGLLHEELELLADPLGLEVAYDGMTFDI